MRFLQLGRDLLSAAEVGAVLRLESKASGFSRTPPMQPTFERLFLASRNQHMPYYLKFSALILEQTAVSGWIHFSCKVDFDMRIIC